VVALEARNEGDERHESLHVDGSQLFLVAKNTRVERNDVQKRHVDFS
jgi:hypothetical protein